MLRGNGLFTLFPRRVHGRPRSAFGYQYAERSYITGVLEIKNTGQTPAYNFIAEDRMCVGLGKTVIGSESPEVSRGLLGPGSNPFILNVEIKVPIEDAVTIPAVQNNPGLISVFGQIQYKDAFDRIWCLGFQLRSGRYHDSTWPLTVTDQGNEEKEGECPRLPPPS
jgi:hypothetical protein